MRQYGYDLARAEQLLDAACFRPAPDGVRMRPALKTSTDESTRLLAEALADQWKRAGVVLELRPLEFATFYSDVTPGSFPVYTFCWVGASNTDPDIFEYAGDSQKMPPGGANRGHYTNSVLNRLLRQPRTEMNMRRRKVILSEAQKIPAEDEPYIDLWYPDDICVHARRVGNLAISPLGDFDFLDRVTLQ